MGFNNPNKQKITNEGNNELFKIGLAYSVEKHRLIEKNRKDVRGIPPKRPYLAKSSINCECLPIYATVVVR